MGRMAKKDSILWFIVLLIIIVGLVIWLVFFNQGTEETLPEEEEEIGGEEEAEIANPASVYCEEQGGVVEIRELEGGSKGFCAFEDGSECEEWAFFNGECQTGENFCNDMCGDGECQEIVCMEVDCPCSETVEACSADCAE